MRGLVPMFAVVQRLIRGVQLCPLVLQDTPRQVRRQDRRPDEEAQHQRPADRRWI